MVTVKFFGLIRSNHGITEFKAEAGTIREIVDTIMHTYPNITEHEIRTAILFVNQEKVMHLRRFSERVQDGDEIVFTNYVGGG